MKFVVWLWALGAVAIGLAAPAWGGPLEDGMAAYHEKEYAKAMELWLPLAERGNPTAQLQVAVLFAEGKGVEQSDTNAAAWFERAAQRGNAQAQYNLGVSYAEGLGVKQDDAQAVKWLRRAADQGMPYAQLNLGFLYASNRVTPPDNIEAVKWLELAIFALPPGGARSDAAKSLKDVADKLSEEELMQARTRQRQFRPKPEPGPVN
jgi:TPR repeat protein